MGKVRIDFRVNGSERTVDAYPMARLLDVLREQIGLTGTRLHPMQEAFAAAGGAQCGICTPGMILAACQLLERFPRPTDDQIREGLAGNLCRCTGYQKIFDAVREAGEAMQSDSFRAATVRESVS